MKNIATAIFAIITCFTMNAHSQETKNFQSINEVHIKFKKAFESLDDKLFAGIHSERLIRIPNGKKIIDYSSYVEQQRAVFEEAVKNNSSISIDLRFIERLNNDSIASEKGIYKYILNKNRPGEKIYYGKFHVIMIKEGSDWKILMDYDSSEGSTISENDFNKAMDMHDIDNFIKNKGPK